MNGSPKEKPPATPAAIDPLDGATKAAPGSLDGAAQATFSSLDSAASAWDGIVTFFIESYFASHPTFAVAAGRHEFDGRLPDWSREGIAAEVDRLRAERSRAERFDPAGLDARRQFEREHLLARIDLELFWLAEAEWPFRNPLFYIDPFDPSIYVTRDYAPLEQRLRAYAGYARAVPEATRQMRANLRLPLPHTYAELGAQSFAGLASFCEHDVPRSFAPAGPAFAEELRAANPPAVAALQETAAWFAEQLRRGRPREETGQAGGGAEGEDGAGFRLGPELFARMLQATERVEVPLAEIERAGWSELERNLAALEEACAVYAPHLPVAACVARVQAAKPAEGPVAAASRQLAGLKRFVEERDLVSIPGDEEARVEEAPPHQRWNAAYIDIPGPFERHLPSIYYIAPPDPSWSAAERAAYLPGEADLLFISAHEVWPGHFLHFLHANRAASPLARVFVGYAFAEGWAHYAEEMIWEAGFGNGDPAIHVGQIQNALLRNVRLLAALGLHAGRMSVEEAAALFRERAFQDPANARQQAARGTFDPAYLNYTLGKLMIRQLRDDLAAATPNDKAGREGRQETPRSFHDRLLAFGGPPLPLVRAALLGAAAGPLLGAA